MCAVCVVCACKPKPRPTSPCPLSASPFAAAAAIRHRNCPSCCGLALIACSEGHRRLAATTSKEDGAGMMGAWCVCACTCTRNLYSTSTQQAVIHTHTNARHAAFPLSTETYRTHDQSRTETQTLTTTPGDKPPGRRRRHRCVVCGIVVRGQSKGAKPSAIAAAKLESARSKFAWSDIHRIGRTGCG